MRKSILFAAVLCGALCVSAQNLENGHEWVDLGLPSGLKWATCNVGADAPEAYGNHYAWGETETKDDYSWKTYKYGTSWTNTNLTKYSTNISYGMVDDLTTLEAEDDAASVNWGGAWRTPTDDEWTELREQCDWTWTADYNSTGVAGRIVTSKVNGNSIFLPAAGTYGDSGLTGVGDYGFYWSSSLYVDGPTAAQSVLFYSGYVGGQLDYRFHGRSVRPVCEVNSPITALQASHAAAIYAENGRIVCEQSFRIYDLLGRDVTRMNGSLNGVYIVKCGEKAVKIVAR